MAAAIQASAVTNGSGTAGTIGSAGTYLSTDIALVTITWQSGSAMSATPAGYTPLPSMTTTGTGNIKIWQGYCVGTPTATTFTLGGIVRWTAIICRISGADTAAPIAVNNVPASAALDATATTHAVVTTSLNTIAPSQLVINTHAVRVSSTTATPTVSSWSAVTGNTLINTAVATALNLNAVGTVMNYEVQAATGASTARTATATLNATAPVYSIASTVVIQSRRIAKTVDVRWNIRSKSAKTIDIRWDIRSKIAKTNNIQWDIRTKTAKTNDFRWDVKTKVAQASDIRWDIRSKAAKTNNIQWDIRSKAAKTNNIQWNVRSKAAKTNDVRWDIRSKTAKTNNFQWNVTATTLTPVAKVLDFRWDMRAKVAKTNNIQWNIRAKVQKTNNLQWNVRTKTTKTNNLQWNVRTKITKNNDIRWDMKAKGTKTLGIQWIVRQRATRTVEPRWDMRQKLARPMDYRWNILSTTRVAVPKVLDFRWNARASVRRNLTTFWFVSTPTVTWNELGVTYVPDWGVVFVPTLTQEEYTFATLAAYIISSLNTWNNPLVGINSKPYDWSELTVPSPSWVET